MNNRLLRRKIEEFLDNQHPRHSLDWLDKIETRILQLESEYPEQHIRRIHFLMISELINEGRRYLRHQFNNYSVQKNEDIVNEAFVNWAIYYNPDHGNESTYLIKCIISANAEDFNNENPILGRERARDEFGNEIFDDSGKPVWIALRATTIKTDFTEIVKINEDVEESLAIKEEADFKSSLPTEDNDGISETTIVNDFSILSRANKILIAKKYDKSRFKTGADNNITKKKKVAERKKIVIMSTAEIVYRHFLLKEAAIDNGRHNTPKISERFTPKKEFIESIKPSRPWNGIYAKTEYFKNRHSILKSAREREYMELSINALREGIDMFDKEISQGYFTQWDKNKIPVLSAVATDKNNNLISYCHKGQIVSINPQRERRSFQKHCEYTLLKEILEENNAIDQLEGGELYVTLEPCNSRTFFCLNPRCDEKCTHENVELKIPCAVRCLESGISKIYIGSIDSNKSVERKGEEILRTGCYFFKLKDGGFYSSQEDVRKMEKEIRSQKLLELYFIAKGYKLEYSDPNEKIYRINNGIQVDYFPPDLIDEICELNGKFLKYYNSSYFH